jgi:hypothetical protein
MSSFQYVGAEKAMYSDDAIEVQTHQHKAKNGSGKQRERCTLSGGTIRKYLRTTASQVLKVT